MRSRVLSTGQGVQQGVEPPRLIVLLADATIPEVHRTYGDYHDIFSDLFDKSLKLATKEDGRGEEGLALEVRSFDAKAGEYPDQAELDAATGLLITGSGASPTYAHPLLLEADCAEASSAYEKTPWIIELVSFTSAVSRTHPRLKLFGICFGHQIVSLAFGGKVEKNAQGWELGVRTVDLTPLGSKVLGKRKDDGTVVSSSPSARRTTV